MTRENTVVQAQYPGNLKSQLKFFDRFTVKDIARITTPAAIGGLTAGPLGAVTGGLLGTGLYTLRWKNRTLDEHAANAANLAFDRKADIWPEDTTIRDEKAVLLEDAAFAAVQVDSCDLEMLSEPQQRGLHQTCHQILQQADQPLEIHSRQRRLPLNDYQIEQEETVVTDHYAVPVIPPKKPDTPVQQLKQQLNDRYDLPIDTGQEVSQQQATQKLDTVCSKAENALTGGRMSAHRLTGEPFLQFVKRTGFSNIQLDNHRYKAEDAEHGKHRKGVQIVDVPSQLPLGWLADVLETPGLIDTVQVADPTTVDHDTLSNILNKTQAERSATNDAVREAELDTRIEKIEELLKLIANGEEQLLDYSIYILAKADTETELETTFEALTTKLDSLQIDYTTPLFLTHRMSRADSVLHPLTSDHTMISPGGSIAAGIPYATSEAINETGVVFGKDANNDQKPLILNRFDWTAPHIARFGASGSGKTTAAKLLLLKSITGYENLNVYIIDVKPEYGDIINFADGETIEVDQDTDIPGFDSSIGRYTFTDGLGKNERIAAALQNLEQQTQEEDQRTIVVVDEAHRLKTTEKGVPTLSRLLREGRSSRTSIEVISQSAEDFTASPEGQIMLQNIDCSILMAHQDVDSSIDDFYRLSDNQSVRLRTLATGDETDYSEALIRVSRRLNTELKIQATPTEQEILNMEEGGGE
jgi:hypothetical protein